MARESGRAARCWRLRARRLGARRMHAAHLFFRAARKPLRSAGKRLLRRRKVVADGTNNRRCIACCRWPQPPLRTADIVSRAPRHFRQLCLANAPCRRTCSPQCSDAPGVVREALTPASHWIADKTTATRHDGTEAGPNRVLPHRRATKPNICHHCNGRGMRGCVRARTRSAYSCAGSRRPRTHTTTHTTMQTCLHISKHDARSAKHDGTIGMKTESWDMATTHSTTLRPLNGMEGTCDNRHSDPTVASPPSDRNHTPLDSKP